MKELKKRGLVYLEDGSVAQSTAPAIAQETVCRCGGPAW